MQDGNDFSVLGWYNTRNGSKRYINYLVIVDYLNINLNPSLVNDSQILTWNTTISSMVNQGSL